MATPIIKLWVWGNGGDIIGVFWSYVLIFSKTAKKNNNKQQHKNKKQKATT